MLDNNKGKQVSLPEDVFMTIMRMSEELQAAVDLTRNLSGPPSPSMVSSILVRIWYKLFFKLIFGGGVHCAIVFCRNYNAFTYLHYRILYPRWRGQKQPQGRLCLRMRTQTTMKFSPYECCWRVSEISYVFQYLHCIVIYIKKIFNQENEHFSANFFRTLQL